MLRRRRSVRSTVAVAGAVIGFALAGAHPAAAQQADRPAADGGGGLEGIVVAPQPNKPASVELVNGPQGGPSANDGAPVAEAKAPGIEGFIEGGVGSHGTKMLGGAVTVPLVKGRLQLSVEGYATHAGIR